MPDPFKHNTNWIPPQGQLEAAGEPAIPRPDPEAELEPETEPVAEPKPAPKKKAAPKKVPAAPKPKAKRKV